MTRPRPHTVLADPAGFTLIEVLMAIAILGTSLFVLLESHYGSLTLFSDAQDTATIRFLTQHAVGMAEQEVQLGVMSGEDDFGKRFPEYSYTFNASAMRPEEMPGLFEVTVSIEHLGESSEFQFLTYDSDQYVGEESPQ